MTKKEKSLNEFVQLLEDICGMNDEECEALERQFNTKVKRNKPDYSWREPKLF